MFHEAFEGAARNAVYASPEIQNELTAIMSDTVLVRTCIAAFHISLAMKPNHLHEDTTFHLQRQVESRV